MRASGNSQERRRQAAAPGEGLIDALWRKSWRDAGSSSHDSPQALPRQDWHHQLDESTQDEVSTLADPMSRAHAALPDMSSHISNEQQIRRIIFLVKENVVIIIINDDFSIMSIILMTTLKTTVCFTYHYSLYNKKYNSSAYYLFQNNTH